MQAMIFKDYRRMELAEVPPPEPAPNEAMVEVAACGTCGSDLEGYLGTPGMRDRRVPPLQLGHEFAGTVVQGPEDWLGKPVAVNMRGSVLRYLSSVLQPFFLLLAREAGMNRTIFYLEAGTSLPTPPWHL